ncbi:MAG: SDR family NAD(P)-dependent oxidoreductase [Tenuifilum sp.]|uniref:SDR family NAD(P)-dependent oxidoreductase n=1 Tax=Tenuifilum sp. TaxID=2760880 RepID=UPI001B70819A|nr:SDR family NAD(P)-dependent oxidoreductase [Bacteroidales bacterium]MBP9029879.1 SDR family NAD(P)-dependent oxidoreductase [Bacteroidales bacterium]HOK61056.1 SDR family NAD(P)-dependent oxidoreductase [Tenuifilum sp.]HPD59679.1 SDR family NAD(P)-dependent oxidoreductase [Paludibacteraceae bacterium]HQI89550.1 SDR family NAD(P)-dependent oxidoreductase [Tenuifilum sp.]
MRTIVITGANSGIGYETAKYLAFKGNTIIAASRQKDETLKIIDNLNLQCKKANSKGSVKFYHLDLNDLKSVKTFAEKVITDYPIIDTLICNAGIMNSPYKVTEDGYEQQFQTNFLSHFYLTHLLIDTIIKSDNPKIINVCSASAEKGTINTIEELEKISKISEQEYNAMKSYREAKLAQQISVMQFARMQEYIKIKFSVIHPGIVNTNLFYRNSGTLYKIAMLPFVYLGYAFGFFKTPKQGAKTTIFLSENDNYESGFYWNNTKQLTPNPISNDENYSKQLYEWTLKKIEKR